MYQTISDSGDKGMNKTIFHPNGSLILVRKIKTHQYAILLSKSITYH